MRTAFEGASTVWDAQTCANPGARPAAPPPSVDGQPAEETPSVPTSKWGMLQAFAERADAAVVIEKEMTQIFDRRSSLARRLSDASKRKDDTLAEQTAKDWITSEIRLAKLWEMYLPFVRGRAVTLKSIGVT